MRSQKEKSVLHLWGDDQDFRGSGSSHRRFPKTRITETHFFFTFSLIFLSSPSHLLYFCRCGTWGGGAGAELSPWHGADPPGGWCLCHLHMHIKCRFYFLPLYSTYPAADKGRQMHFHWQSLTESFGVERIFGDGIWSSLSPLHCGRIDCFISKWSLMDEYWAWASVKSEDDNSVLLMPLKGEVNLLNCLEVLQFPMKCLKQSCSTFATAWPAPSSYPPFYPCIEHGINLLASSRARREARWSFPLLGTERISDTHQK